MMVISVRRLLRLLVVLGAGLGLLVPLVVAVGAAPAQADDGGLVPDGLSAVKGHRDFPVGGRLVSVLADI